LIKTLESPNNHELLWFAEKYSPVRLEVSLASFTPYVNPEVSCIIIQYSTVGIARSRSAGSLFLKQEQKNMENIFCPTGASKIMQSPPWTTHVDSYYSALEAESNPKPNPKQYSTQLDQ
jgi:hypothetical protein